MSRGLGDVYKRQKLSNEKFTARAPEAVVHAEREKAEKFRALLAQLTESKARLEKLQ